MLRPFIALWLMSAPLAVMAGQDTCTVRTSATRICLSDTLVAEYLFSGDHPASLQQPKFQDFRMAGKPELSQQAQLTIVNGRRETHQQLRAIYRLLPLKTGHYTLPQLKAGKGDSSCTRSVEVVADCSQRQADTSFHTPADEEEAFFREFAASEGAGLVNPDEHLFYTGHPFVLVLLPARSPEPGARSGLLDTLDRQLGRTGARRIGWFTVRGNPQLYYGIRDSSTAPALVRQRLRAAGVEKGFRLRLLQGTGWAQETETLKNTPEYGRYIDINGLGNSLLSSRAALDQPKDYYIIFRCRTAAGRQGAIALARSKGFRTPDVLDGPDGPDRYLLWIAQRTAYDPAQLFSLVNDIVRDMDLRFKGAVRYESVRTAQQP